MLLQRKLRIGAMLITGGSLLAVLGEILNLWNNDPSTGGWFFTMSVVVLGVAVLIYGINMYAQLSDKIDIVGLIGAVLLFLGGLLTIIGIVSVNMIALPTLLGMALAIATIVNAPGSAAQSAANATSSALDTAKNGITGLFGQSGGSDIPPANVPGINGVDVVNKMLDGLHLPSLTGISRWGHFFFSGGLLTIGCLVMGYALLRAQAFPRSTCYFLMIAAVLNLVSQILINLLPGITNFTSILFFASLAWLGASILFPEETSRLSMRLPLLAKGT